MVHGIRAGALRGAFLSTAIGLAMLAWPAGAELSDVVVVAQSGDMVIGLDPSLTLDRIFDPGINRSGELFFPAWITGPGVGSSNDDVLLVTNGQGGIALVYREGDPLPGVPPGVVPDAGLIQPRIDDAGRVYALIRLQGPGVDTSNDYGYWIWDSAGGFRLLLREGDPAPGTGGLPVTYLDLIGQVSGGTFLVGGSSNGVNRIWRSDVDGDLQVFLEPGVMVDGQAATGVGNRPNAGDPTGGVSTVASVASESHTVYFDSSAAGTSIIPPGEPLPGTGGNLLQAIYGRAANSAGQVAFTCKAGALNPNNWVFIGDGTNLSLVAGEGDPVPGAPPGVLLGAEHPTISFQDKILLTEDGMAVFLGLMTGPGVNPNLHGIFAGDASHLWTVARPGAPAPGLAPGATFTSSESFDVNDRGDVIFTAGTTQGTVIYVAHGPDTPPVPLLRSGDVVELAPGDSRTITTLFASGLSVGRESANAGDRLAVRLGFADGSFAAITATLPDAPLLPTNVSVPALDVAAGAALLGLLGAGALGRLARARRARVS